MSDWCIEVLLAYAEKKVNPTNANVDGRLEGVLEEEREEEIFSLMDEC